MTPLAHLLAAQIANARGEPVDGRHLKSAYALLSAQTPTPDLTLRTIIETSIERCARWHPDGGVMAWSASDWGVAIGGEVGEVLNAIKKLNRITGGYANKNKLGRQLVTAEAAIQHIAKEMADTLLYMPQLAARLGFANEFPQIVREVFNATSVEYEFPERL